MTYLPGDTPVHRCDARVKIALLLVYSIAIFFAGSWWAMAGFFAIVVIVGALAHVPFGVMNRLLVPVYVFGAFSVVFNVIAAPNADGLLAGLFFCVRMVLLVAASFEVCLTTTSAELLGAFGWFIEPLRILRVPVDDIALTLALSIRFIPMIEREFSRIRAAQVSRGAESASSLLRAAEIWAGAFAALFVGLFRHADALADAMDARCYGASPVRTRLPKDR